MPRMYTVTGNALTITTAGTDTDLIELTAADDKPIELVGLSIMVTSEVAEAQEEWLNMKIIRGHTTSGSTPEVTPTPRPCSHIDTAAGFTCEMDNTTIASAGTGVDLASPAMNVRAGYEVFYPERCGFFTDQAAGLLVVRLMTTVADDLTMNITAWVNEYP